MLFELKELNELTGVCFGVPIRGGGYFRCDNMDIVRYMFYDNAEKFGKV
jgi:hypothetical protein